MEEQLDPKKSSRRDFLRNMGLVTSGSVLGGAALMAGLNFEHNKSMSSRIKALTTEHELIEIDDEGKILEPVRELKGLQLAGREGIKGKRWVMVIDLARCRNARQCIKACQAAHDLKPDQYHINTLQMQDNEHTAPYNMPKPCQHCDNPPCVAVCPVDATFKRPDGIVLIDNERCIGCRFCVAACPYSARVFHWTEPNHKPGEENKVYNVELNVPQKKGTITKCLFSADRLRVGKLPYCVSSCPNGVYYFGDENEDSVTNGTTKETVRLSELLRDNAGYNLMEELGTKPRVYYLPPKNRVFPFQEGSVLENEQHA